MILFCLPYAGGSEAIFYKWKNYMDASIKLYTIELKGRGKRFDEPFYENLGEAVEDIFSKIKDKICCDDYAIFGHSMGSLLAYELYYKINEMGAKKPSHIFFSGYGAPGSVKETEILSTLPDYDFMNKIMKLGGTPEEFLESKELLELYIPIIKNDFKITERYEYQEKPDKIQCDISILNGKLDSINLQDVLSWNNYCSKKCRIYNFEGDHFFINSHIQNVTDIINNTLTGKRSYSNNF